jgi:hypothetical protein
MTDLEKIATDCRAAVAFYTEKPGRAEDPQVIIDIYARIELLALATERRLNSIDRAMPIQPCGVDLGQVR